MIVGPNARKSDSVPLPRLGIGRKMRRQDLDRDGAIQARVTRPVHFPHAARAQRRLNFIEGPSFMSEARAIRARNYSPRGTSL